RRRGVLRHPDQAPSQTRRLPIRRRPPGRHQPLPRRSQRPFKALPMGRRSRQNHRRRQAWAPSVRFDPLAALEKAKTEKEAHGEFESECPGYCCAQDTFYVGNMKGVGRIYQQTFIDTYSKVAFAKLYDRKTPITAADLLNDRVVPFYDAREVAACRVLTDRGTEYCGNPERHEYELYLALEDIDHSRTKTKSPQTNGIVERFHKTVLDEFYRIAFRKKIYGSIADLQVD